MRHPKIERFPKGLCVRRADGTIATVQGIRGLALGEAFRLAQCRAEQMDLSPEIPSQQRRTSLDRLPKVQTTLRHRFAGADRPVDLQWSIYMSFQLPLVSWQGKHRWATASVGNLHALSAVRIERAWRTVHAQWAWITSLKQTVPAADLFAMSVPDSVDEFIELIDLPSPPTVTELWARVGFDPSTGRDTSARQRERLAIGR